jgi:hypothetical protein
VNAFLATLIVLDQYTDHHWSELMDHVRDKRLKLAASKGLHPESFVNGIDEEDITGIKKLFGEMDDTTLSAYTTQLNVDVNLANLNILGAEKKKSEEEIAEISVRYIRHFLTQAQVAFQPPNP